MYHHLIANTIIPLAVIFLVPIILYRLEKHLLKNLPANDKIPIILAKIEEDKTLALSMKKYCNICAFAAMSTWVVLVLVMFFNLWPLYSEKYGPNSFVYILPVIILFSSLAPIFYGYQPIIVKLFKKTHPNVDSNLFLLYSSYYTPNENFTPSRKVDYARMGIKMLTISMIIFVPSSILTIFFAVI